MHTFWEFDTSAIWLLTHTETFFFLYLFWKLAYKIFLEKNTFSGKVKISFLEFQSKEPFQKVN